MAAAPYLAGNHGQTTGATMVIPVSQAVPATDGIVSFGVASGSGMGGSGITDSKSNTYTTNLSTFVCCIGYANLPVTALTTSDTCTISAVIGTTPKAEGVLIGLPSVTAFDAIGSWVTTGGASSPASVSVTPTAANDTILGIFGLLSPAAGLTAGGGATLLGSWEDVQTSVQIYVVYITNAPNSTQSLTLGATVTDWSGIAIAYKAPASATSATGWIGQRKAAYGQPH